MNVLIVMMLIGKWVVCVLQMRSPWLYIALIVTTILIAELEYLA